MAGTKTQFSVNTNRIDPYKNFKFRMIVASAFGAIVGFGMVNKAIQRVGSQQEVHLPCARGDQGRTARPNGPTDLRRPQLRVI